MPKIQWASVLYRYINPPTYLLTYFVMKVLEPCVMKNFVNSRSQLFLSTHGLPVIYTVNTFAVDLLTYCAVLYLLTWFITALGCSVEEKALVNQWMEYRLTRIDPCDDDAKCLQGILNVTEFVFSSDVVLRTKVLVMRHLEDKKNSLDFERKL